MYELKILALPLYLHIYSYQKSVIDIVKEEKGFQFLITHSSSKCQTFFLLQCTYYAFINWLIKKPGKSILS